MAGDTGIGRESVSTMRRPRWVKVFGIIAIVLALLVVIVLLTSGGEGHGPGRHGLGSRTPSSFVT